MSARLRLDELLVQRRLVSSRSQARARILAGEVTVDGRPVDKAGTPVAPDARVEIAERARFASRGGDKLAPVLAAARVDPGGRVCLDVGASTGGFTDCLLQHGAAAVAAVDVGRGQLAWKLRQDPRVLVLERLNARYLEPHHLAGLPRLPELALVDVSFIGATKILPALTRVTARPGEALVLVKPQFEAGPDRVERGGVVRSAAVRRDCLRSVARAAEALGWGLLGVYPSPLRGPAGNWECFLHLAMPAPPSSAVEELIAQVEIPDEAR